MTGSYKENYQYWLRQPALSVSEKNELLSIKDDESEIKSRFSRLLSFGTAGLRSIMKTGMNAMNRHTVALATQALANLIVRETRQQDGVVIAFDCRNQSPEFAKVSACVLAANGIKVYLFDSLRPTPELSYSLRELHCVAGINVTASHNPKEYNGYKVYWDDGAQLPPQHAETVSREMNSLDIFTDVRTVDFVEAKSSDLIVILGHDMDEKYLSCVSRELVNPDIIKPVSDQLKIVYTPLHGAGYHLVPEILRRVGFSQVFTVPSQMVIDGNFPTVGKPNPEYPESFREGIKIADEIESDLIIATDPDADRVGVMSRRTDSTFVNITGNQMGCLLLDYIISAYEKNGRMPQNPYAVKSIVSTELASRICLSHHVKMNNVLTGFKYIGEMIKLTEASGTGSFLLGFEESYGYLKGTYARDKDAVVTSMLICEMAAYYKTQNMTLYDALQNLFARYGCSYETNQEFYMNGSDSFENMSAVMAKLRSQPKLTFGGTAVSYVADYLEGTVTYLEDGRKEATTLPRSNVLYYKLANDDVIVVRPSGTEPKIKIYYLLLDDRYDIAKSRCTTYQDAVSAWTGMIAKS